jgi:cytochrome c oxidase cbb3-type subunit III
MRRAWLVALAVLGCSSSGGREPLGPEAAVAGEGRALYDKYCALCHGPNLEGYAADNANALANQGFLSTASDDFLYTAIARGRPGTAMAAYHETFGGPLAPDNIQILVAFIRSFQSGPALEVDQLVKGDAAAGAPLYAELCAGCHGARGQGKIAISLNNPIFLSSASDGFIRHAIERGREGTAMPAFGTTLGAEEIDHLTRFVRSFASTSPEMPVAGEIPPTFEQVVIHPKGPAPRFSPLRDGRYVPADEVKAAFDAGARMVLLDARPTSDWLRAHIPGALPVPYYEPEKMIGSLPKDGTWIISYCGCPHAASGKVMDVLRTHGFDNTAVLDEGIFVWMERGYPIAHGAAP